MGLSNSRIDVLYDNNAIYACLIIGQNFARGIVSFERLRGNVHLKKTSATNTLFNCELLQELQLDASAKQQA